MMKLIMSRVGPYDDDSRVLQAGLSSCLGPVGGGSFRNHPFGAGMEMWGFWHLGRKLVGWLRA